MNRLMDILCIILAAGTLAAYIIAPVPPLGLLVAGGIVVTGGVCAWLEAQP